MATYVILSQIPPEALSDPKGFKEVAAAVIARIKQECPKVVWKQSYVTMGRFDVVDIVESDDPNQVERASLIIRAVGRSMTETLPARPWDQFMESL